MRKTNSMNRAYIDFLSIWSHHLNKPKLRQVYTNDGIITQYIFNTAVSTSVELKTNTKKLYVCGYLIYTMSPSSQIADITV